MPRSPARVFAHEERLPGQRGDISRVVDGGNWATITTARVALVGADTPGGRRLVETADFTRFTRAGLEDLPRRWATYREHAATPRADARVAKTPG